MRDLGECNWGGMEGRGGGGGITAGTIKLFKCRKVYREISLVQFSQEICFNIYIYYSFDTGEYHESVGLVFTRVPQARA